MKRKNFKYHAVIYSNRWQEKQCHKTKKGCRKTNSLEKIWRRGIGFIHGWNVSAISNFVRREKCFRCIWLKMYNFWRYCRLALFLDVEHLLDVFFVDPVIKSPLFIPFVELWNRKLSLHHLKRGYDIIINSLNFMFDRNTFSLLNSHI